MVESASQSSPGRWNAPSQEVLDALHDRYLHEVVIARNICPFAQRAMDLGQVKRLWWRAPTRELNTQEVVKRFGECVQDPNLDIVLLSFALPPEDPCHNPANFDRWHRRFRTMLEQNELDKDWYSVCFHPQAGRDAQCTESASRFVAVLRQSPDPVIQCVKVSTLEAVRAKAQASAHQQMIETLRAQCPEMALLAESCVMTDSGLSTSIADKNFERWGHEPGWSELSSNLEELHEARQLLEERAKTAKP